MAGRVDFNGLLARLRSPDAAARDGAGAELLAHGRMGLNTSEALSALQAAAEAYAPPSSGRDFAADLLAAAARAPRRVYVPVLEECFGRYGPRARVEALRLLLRIGDERAARAWLALVRRHAAELSSAGTDALLDDPRALEVLFPDALQLVAWPALAAELCDTASALCAEGLLDPGALLPALGPLLAAEAASRAAMDDERSGEADFGRRPAFLGARSVRLALLDLLGWLPCGEAEACLRRGLEDPELRVKALAIAALARRGAPVDPLRLAEVGADPEQHSWLQARLAEARHALPLLEPDAKG